MLQIPAWMALPGGGLQCPPHCLPLQPLLDDVPTLCVSLLITPSLFTVCLPLKAKLSSALFTALTPVCHRVDTEQMNCRMDKLMNDYIFEERKKWKKSKLNGLIYHVSSLKDNIVKKSNLTKLIYRFKAIIIKIPENFLVDIDDKKF